MLCKEVQNYIATAKGLPFFYVFGDEDYYSDVLYPHALRNSDPKRS